MQQFGVNYMLILSIVWITITACTFLLHIPVYIMIIIYIFLPVFIYILLRCVTYFALFIERTWPDLHFTTDYIVYNWVCDE